MNPRSRSDREAARASKRSRRGPDRPVRPVALPAAPLLHPALLLALAAVAACLLTDVTFQMTDTDFWEHLLVGKVIWTQHRIPLTNEWTWPTFGERQVLPSWAFRAMLWPFWAAVQMAGLQIWRWVTTLTAFTLVWLTARRLGARGFASLLLISWCALVYRHRVYVRPETLSGVLLAVTLWILETRRQSPAGSGRDRSWWLVGIAWIWVNVHISWWMLFALLGIHALDDRFTGSKRRPRLEVVAVVAALACFLNPFGWRALAEPFMYALVWRNEAIYRTIGELQPVDWKFLGTTGYVALLPLWPLLTALRARRHGWDLAELLSCALFSVLGLWNQRFVSVWALMAAPYLARGAASLTAEIRWPASLRPVWARAALVIAVIVIGRIPDWRRTDLPLGTGVMPSSYPEAAADFMAGHGVRGPGFNHFELGGYLLWRFWPEHDRLPFMDIHVTGSLEDRRLAGMMLSDPNAWAKLETKYPFEWALLRHLHGAGDVSLDILEADSTWRLVFLDDAAALYLKRGGRFAALADSFGYQYVRAGRTGLAAMGRVLVADTVARVAIRREIERMADSSPAHSGANSLLTQLDLLAGNWAAAREHLVEAHRVDPQVPLYHERLGIIAQRMGDRAGAERELREALRHDPNSVEARRGLESLSGNSP
jgi:hypothetical protein